MSDEEILSDEWEERHAVRQALVGRSAEINRLGVTVGSAVRLACEEMGVPDAAGNEQYLRLVATLAACRGWKSFDGGEA